MAKDIKVKDIGKVLNWFMNHRGLHNTIHPEDDFLERDWPESMKEEERDYIRKIVKGANTKSPIDVSALLNEDGDLLVSWLLWVMPAGKNLEYVSGQYKALCMKGIIDKRTLDMFMDCLEACKSLEETVSK